MNKPKLIIGTRHSGKTLELIKMSAETGIYILVTNEARARVLFDQARNMGYTIPFPVTVQEYLRSRFDGSIIRKRGIYVDDADDVFKQFWGSLEIHAATITDYRGTLVEPEIIELKPWLKANPHLNIGDVRDYEKNYDKDSM